MGARRHCHSRLSVRRGFTLLEALFSAGILFMVVVAVTAAVTAGQQHAFEARQRIAASMAAEELVARVTCATYADLTTFHGFREAAGAMTDGTGAPYPASYGSIGRTISVTTRLEELPGLGVKVRGREVLIRAVDATGGVLFESTQFIPEPQP